METDADRLASIKGLGGQLVRTSSNAEFWAIFDEEYLPALSDGSIESLGPALNSCRSSDLLELQVRKGDPLRVEGTDYKVHRIEKTDVPGFSRVMLSK